MKYRVIGIGDNVVDKYLHTGLMYPGGNALNFSVYAKQLGLDSAFMGVFGDDEPARHVQDTLRHLGIDTQQCRRYPGENGYACIDLIDGERTFIHSNKGGVLREHPLIFESADVDYISGFDLVHVSLNSYLENQLEIIKQQGVLLSFDFSMRGTDDYFRQVCPFIDCGFVSCSHLSEEETKNKLNMLFDYGCHTVVATRGHEGVYHYDGDEIIFYRPDYIKPVDTLGAGDSFLTGFLVSFLFSDEKSNGTKREKILTAIEKGNQLAGKTLRYFGAFGYGTSFIE
ncbi:fructoselysine 6-kinase [Pectobacterium aroidearum]|uniref:fructoselysine 6-kinase n=1 Tax=Pectobacterium aroidearum TaxID=1201031 RepID=UPI002FC95000